jgi:glycosyltransferase involved in cell wall biosynthesis
MVSVVTPYHNTDHDLFDACARSLMKQTIGFLSVEWVIVMHNCDDEHVRHVYDKLEGFPNVRLFELENDSRGASSPRNFGLAHASAPYVAFMDSDDRYTPDALDAVVRCGTQHDADIVVYRRDYELTSPAMTPIAITVPWDRTRDVIVLDKHDAIESRTYNDFPIFITDRAFRRQFLIDNGIAFDEDIMIGEDCHFNLRALHMAERVCYMPQLIGYTYLINDGSILNNEKTDDEVNRVIDNNVAIIERALAYGFYPNHIILAMCFSLSLCLLSRGVSMETRLRAERLMRPYLALTEPIRPDRFLTPLRSALNDLYHDVLMSPERFGPDAHDRIPESFHNLDVILQENADTDYGRRYCFDNVVSYEGYRSLVPLSDASTYRPMVELETRIGDTNIYHGHAPAYYLRSDGEGEYKGNEHSLLLPVSVTQAEACARVLDEALGDGIVVVWDSGDSRLERARNQALVGDACGIALSAWLDARRYTKAKDDRDVHIVIPSRLTFRGVDTETTRMMLAASERDVERIVCFGDHVPEALGVLWPDSVEEMADCIEAMGHVMDNDGQPGEQTLKPSQARITHALMTDDPRRPDMLRQIAEDARARGLERVSIRDLWHDLAEIVVIETRPGSDWPETIDGVPVRRVAVMNEAGVMATVDPETDDYVLDMSHTIYEFRVQGDDPDSPDANNVVSTGRIRTGDVIVPVITTDAGLYRYQMRDIALRVTGTDGGRLRVRPA